MAEAAVAVMIASSAAEGIAGYEAADARKQALQEREAQEQAAANQKSIQRTEQLRKVIGAQEAAAGARGYSVTSPSFQAIQSSTFDEWAADEKATQLSMEFEKGSLEAQESAETAAGYGALFGSAANIFQIGMQTGTFGSTPATTPAGAVRGTAGNALTAGNLPGTRNLYKNFRIGL